MSAKKAKTAQLVSLLFGIGRFMREEGGKRKIKGSPCSLLQFETLRFVKEHERPLMRDVAQHFNVTPPAATLLVDGLVREKLIGRVVDRKDRRAVQITLTGPGRALLARGMKERIARLKRIFSALSDREKDELIGLLKKMATSIGLSS